MCKSYKLLCIYQKCKKNNFAFINLCAASFQFCTRFWKYIDKVFFFSIYYYASWLFLKDSSKPLPSTFICLFLSIKIVFLKNHICDHEAHLTLIIIVVLFPLFWWKISKRLSLFIAKKVYVNGVHFDQNIQLHYYALPKPISLLFYRTWDVQWKERGNVLSGSGKIFPKWNFTLCVLKQSFDSMGGTTMHY